MGMTGTVNMLDGLDGLATGVTAIAALVLFVHMLRLGQYSVSLLPLALLGCCLGFLPLQLLPRRASFLGGGAYVLGFALATLSIVAGAKVASALLVLWVPIVDVVWQVYSRWRRGQPMALGDRGHLHFRLQDLGWPRRRIVLLYYAITALLGAVALTDLLAHAQARPCCWAARCWWPWRWRSWRVAPARAPIRGAREAETRMSQVTNPSPAAPSRAATGWRTWFWRAAPWALMLLALLLRLYHLDAQSLWYDEGWSIELAHESPARALVRLQEFADPHPPGYYLLLIAWANLFGRGVFVLRAFSALLGVATVGALYWTGRRLFDRATGLLAAALLTLSSAHWVYSQEMRMYTLLTLCLAPLLGLFYRYGARREGWGRKHWAAMITLEALALYTHFFALFALIGLCLWLGLRLALDARRGDARPLWRWLLSQGLVALAYLPWVPVALQRAATHTTQSGYTQPLGGFLWTSWAFLAGGHADLVGREPRYALVAAVALAALAVGLALTLWRDRARAAVVYLMAQVLLPTLGVYALMVIRPGYHPRYLFMVLLPLVLLIARGGVVFARQGRLALVGALLLTLPWLGANGLASRALLTDRYYDHDDARATAALLREHLAPGSVVLMSHDEWALHHYLRESGLVDLHVRVDQDTPGAIQTIETALQGPSQATGRPVAALVYWGQANVDFQGVIPYLLERQGTLVQEHRLPGYEVLLYTLDAEPPALETRRVGVNLGPLRLEDAVVQTWVPVDEATTVALTWRLEAPLAEDLKVALSLVDERGRVLARRDQFLRDALGRHTSRWDVSQVVTNYTTLPFPPGIAPLDYAIELSVYHEGDLAGLDVLDGAGAPAGKQYALATLALTPRLGRAPQREVDRQQLGLVPLSDAPEVAPGLRLNAVHLERDRYQTGERLSVLLEWRHADTAPLADYWPELRLVRDGAVLAAIEEAPVYGRYPTGAWAPGEVVLDWRELTIPAEDVGGPAELLVRVYGEAPVSLGQIEIVAVARQMRPPDMGQRVEIPLGNAALLTGYDLSGAEVAAGGALSVTLYWQALEPTAQGAGRVRASAERGRTLDCPA